MNNAENKSSKKIKKPHFNVIDTMIVILLVVAVAGIYFRYNISDIIGKNKNLEEYAVSFSIKNMRYTTPNYINVGDKVYFAGSGDLFGELISESENKGVLNITPASEFFVDSSGNVVEAFYPNDESRINAKGRMLCKGIYTSDGGFCVDGTTYIARGKTVDVYTELVTVTITVTDIEPYTAEIK